MTALNPFCSYGQAEGHLFFSSPSYASDPEGWRIREASNERPSETLFPQQGYSTGKWVRGFSFLKMPVLMEVGEDTPRINSPTTGFSGSSKLNFLGLDAKECQEGELGLQEVSPRVSRVYLDEEETSSSCLPRDWTQLLARWRGNVLAASGCSMKLKTNTEKNPIRTRGTDSHWRTSSPGRPIPGQLPGKELGN